MKHAMASLRVMVRMLLLRIVDHLLPRVYNCEIEELSTLFNEAYLRLLEQHDMYVDMMKEMVGEGSEKVLADWTPGFLKRSV